MTPEERFDRIESGLAALVEAQRVHAESLSQLMRLVSESVDAGNARARRFEEELSELTRVVANLVDTADARMRRIEENLDGLIRAITAEHSNGKSRN